MQTVSEWAAFHHERLDGNGYPFHKKAHEINTGARIIAVSDIFTALIEDRPYRKGMNIPDVRKILLNVASTGVQDYQLIHHLIDNMEDICRNVKDKQAQARHFYHTQIECSAN